MWFWIKSWIKNWSKKEETPWETWLENTAAQLRTCLIKYGLVGDAWDAELWLEMLSHGLLLF